jgi:hypothetical protein
VTFGGHPLFTHERQSGEVAVNQILETKVSQCARTEEVTRVMSLDGSFDSIRLLCKPFDTPALGTDEDCC